MNFSFRDRVAFFYMTATALLIGLIFAAVYVIVFNTVYNHLNGDLDAESNEIHRSLVILNHQFVFANPYEWGEKEHNQFEVNPTFIQIVDTAGKIIKRSGNLFDKKLEFKPGIQQKIYYNTVLYGSPARQMQLPINNPGGQTLGYLIIGIPLEESAVVLKDLRYVLLISYPLVLVLLFFTSRLIAGKSISPIDKVVKTAERITKENLSERIELPQHKDEIYLLTKKINELLDRIEDTVLREKQFTSDASHELRTPLSIIKGTLEVLIRKPREVEFYENKIKYIISETDRMAELVEQLLTLARYDSNKIKPDFKQVDLTSLLLSVIERNEKQLADKNLNLKFKPDKEYLVQADIAMTDIILQNIFTNSIKYSGNDGNIDVDIIGKEESIHCIIKDNGIGMSSEETEKVFDRFYRADESRSAGVEGNGLGMSIVKKLADLQNTGISIISQTGKGTTVILKFAK